MNHEKYGEFILWSGFVIVGIAFLGRMIAGWRSEQDIFADMADKSTRFHWTFGVNSVVHYG